MTVKENGKINEIIPFNVGFRRIEIKPIEQKAANGKPYVCLFINGQPLKLKGVNIHEHNPSTGHYVTEDLMRRDFELMKQHNLNSVRLCHYPQDRRFYELVMNTDFMYMMKPTWKATECIMISGKAVHWVTIPNG